MSAADRGADDQVPKLVAHVTTAMVGVMFFLGGIGNLLSSLPMVLGIWGVVVGAATLVLTWASWKGSRIGWSFAITIDGLSAVGNLLGATKIRDALGVPMAVALIPFFLSATACILLSSFHADYDNT